jgi:transcriptional regulator with XRE-family HTH domain
MSMAPPPIAVKLYIRRWMEKRGLSQERLAERLDCKQATVSRLLSGKMQMTLEWMVAIALALNIEVRALYEDPDAEDAAAIFSKLPEDKRQQAIEFLKFLTETKK